VPNTRRSYSFGVAQMNNWLIKCRSTKNTAKAVKLTGLRFKSVELRIS
jgi:hypothetical protein